MRAALRTAAAAPPLRPAASAAPPAAIIGGAAVSAIAVVAVPVTIYTAEQREGGANPHPRQHGLEVASEQHKPAISGDADGGGCVGRPRGSTFEQGWTSSERMLSVVPTKPQAFHGIGEVLSAPAATGGGGEAALEDAWAELVAEPNASV